VHTEGGAQLGEQDVIITVTAAREVAADLGLNRILALTSGPLKERALDKKAGKILFSSLEIKGKLVRWPRSHIQLKF
jgi:hypothetical protein